MLIDIQTVMWKEWREMLKQRSDIRGSFSLFVVIAAFSLFFPTQFGIDWVSSPAVVFFSGWFPFLLLTQIIADSFAGERERHTLETLLASRLSDRSILLGKVFAASSFGWFLTLLILIISLVAVNLLHGTGTFLFYTTSTMLGSIVLSFLGASLSAQIGVIISLRTSTVRQTQQILSLMAMSPIFLLVFVGQLISAKQKAALIDYFTTLGSMKIVFLFIVVLIVVNFLLFLIASLRFQRTRLILD